MAVATAAAPTHRQPRTRDFVRLKLRILRSSFRGEAWRFVVWLILSLAGLFLALLTALGLLSSGFATPGTASLVATLAGTAVVLGWALFPLLFFGVDETLDPARFALLPVRPLTLARGMLAAAFIGVPALVTLLATSGLIASAGIRFGWPALVAAAVGVVLGLVIGVVASRAITSAFAALLRSRRARDFAAILLALIASSIGPLNLLIASSAGTTFVDNLTVVAKWLGWTPLAAPYLLPFDVGRGEWLLAAAHLAIAVVAIGLLLWWWSRTIESAMIGVTSQGRAHQTKGSLTGAVSTLIPRSLRSFARPTVFGAILAREWRYWWRDARRRSSMISIMVASAVLPIALNVGNAARGAAVGALPFSFAASMAGTMGGMLMANQFAFDGSAFAAHLLARVPGRTELRARAAAVALVAVPVQAAVIIAFVVITGQFRQLPTGVGMLGAAFGAALASSAFLSVRAAFALPENTNPFALNSGGGSAKGMLAVVAMLGTLLLCVPAFVLTYLFAGLWFGPWLVLVFGLAYGLGLATFGTYVAGGVLDRRGPELLIDVSPKRA